MDTFTLRKEDVIRKWYLVDASGVPLGRLASFVAVLLRGKNKPTFTPHVDCGDNVVVINAEKIKLTGNKMDDKVYITYSLHPGGQKVRSVRDMLVKKPEAVVENAVRGMLPKNRLGKALFGNLSVFAGTEHNHEAQKPREIKLNTIK